MSSKLRLKLGTRASPLARWQAAFVARQLTAAGVDVELVPVATQGDVRGEPIGEIDQTGVFTKELERALLDRRIDLAVHSLKDLPTDPVAGLALAAVPRRETPHDALVSRDRRVLKELPAAAVIGTGSLRRQAQLLHARADLTMKDIRGNVDTRLRKLEQGHYDALVLAEAGLRRLGLTEQIAEILPTDVMLPAVGQGALGIEARADDRRALEALSAIDDEPSHQAVLAERSLLAALRGGCLAPVAAWGRLDAAGRLTLDAAVLSPDGRQRLTAAGEAEPSAALELGRRVAADLLAQGAERLIAQARQRS